jgi:hypothetical protein
MKEKKKKYTVTFEEDSYIKIKQYCDDNALKVGGFIEKIVLNHIKDEKNK